MAVSYLLETKFTTLDSLKDKICVINLKKFYIINWIFAVNETFCWFDWNWKIFEIQGMKNFSNELKFKVFTCSQ